MYPPEGDLRSKQDKEASMQEMRVGIKTGFWFRVLKSERSEETVHMGRQPVGESKSRRVKRGSGQHGGPA